jgi:hypothetical protein
MTFIECQPGDCAPNSGDYPELNVLGSPTGKVVLVAKGGKLPIAPRGFTWRSLSERSVAEIRAQAAEYRRMAGTARTAAVMRGLHKVADRLEALAEQREREGKGET